MRRGASIGSRHVRQADASLHSTAAARGLRAAGKGIIAANRLGATAMFDLGADGTAHAVTTAVSRLRRVDAGEPLPRKAPPPLPRKAPPPPRVRASHISFQNFRRFSRA